MTTRKQKHQQAVERREHFLAELRRTNEEALQKDREHREHRLRESQRSNHDKEHSWKKINLNCILCKDRLAAQKRQQRQLEATASG